MRKGKRGKGHQYVWPLPTRHRISIGRGDFCRVLSLRQAARAAAFTNCSSDTYFRYSQEMPPKKEPPKSVQVVDSSEFELEPCGCGGKCNKTVPASALHLLCFSCQCPVLAACLQMTTAMHSYLMKTPNFLFVCDSCKCESVPASVELRELKVTVEKMAKVICPSLAAEEVVANGSEAAADEDENADAWTVASSKKRRKHRSYAEASSKQSPFCQVIAETVSQAIEERDKEELQKRTIVVENCVQNPDCDDMQLAADLCHQIHPSINVLGVHRMRPPTVPKAAGGNQQQNNSNKKQTRPPILKLFLRSPTDKSLAIRHKSNLQYGAEWMQKSSVRPSLPLEVRQKRDQLNEVARARNGSDPPKTDRFLVWLNPRSERYELRQVKQGEWVTFADVRKPTDAELATAKAAIEKRFKDREVVQKKLSTANSKSLNSQ